MRTLEMEIAIPEVKGGRCVGVELKGNCILAKFEIKDKAGKNKKTSISKSGLECRIDPKTFAGKWLEHQPTTSRQMETLYLYNDAKTKGRLHTFSCMTIDPAIKDGKLIYQKGLQPAVKFSQKEWEKMLKNYNPSRNSRQMTRTEYICKNMFIIQRLVESGYKIEEAWAAVCDNSKKMGHYCNSAKSQIEFEPTGSREICGFCDLANTWKLLAEDPWDKAGGYWAAGGSNWSSGHDYPILSISHENNVVEGQYFGVGMLAFD